MDSLNNTEDMPDGLQNILAEYEQRIRACEERAADQAYDLTGFVDSAFKRRDRRELHRTTEFSLYKAWCCDTLDPRRQGRVRYFSPYLHDPGTPIKNLPWAEPISWCGGFDDCGSVWVPPAGSTLVLLFEAGSVQIAYYMGTMWPRDRGPHPHYWMTDSQVFIDEYEKIHCGHRKGYFHGPYGANSERQVLPQWNTENYDTMDWDGYTEEPVGESACKISYPNIMGFKTPQKHMVKFVDGDYRCLHRWKRFEILSSLGNWMLFKDDHLHEAQWPNPKCQVPCEGPEAKCVTQGGGCPSKDKAGCRQQTEGEAANPHFKHQNECRPYRGPLTPQNNRCALPQAGLQLLSTSGHTFFFDDSVEIPRGEPKWEKVLEPFDFGCTNIFIGKGIWKSTTGHRVEVNDEEQEPYIRGRIKPIEKPCDQTWNPWKWRLNEEGARNGILLLTATGNRLEMSDHTLPSGCVAGKARGVKLRSTSDHTIEMMDYTNKQCNKSRREGVEPAPKAEQAYVKIRSGYGLEMMMADYHSQEHCQEQYIQILAPQKGYKDKKGACCGPHIVRIQESPSCGYIFVRAAGDYIRITAGDEVIAVGFDCLGPKNHMRFVSKDTIVATEELYYNYAHDHVFFAEQYIVLAAGRDCKTPSGDGPCLYQVATSKCATYCPIFRNTLVCLMPQSFSTRVFASNDDSKCG